MVFTCFYSVFTCFYSVFQVILWRFHCDFHMEYQRNTSGLNNSQCLIAVPTGIPVWILALYVLAIPVLLLMTCKHARRRAISAALFPREPGQHKPWKALRTRGLDTSHARYMYFAQ